MDSYSVVRRILSSYLWISFSFVLSMVRQLAIIPFILIFWGELNYSLWIVLVAATNILYTINHGYLQYVGNLLNLQFHVNPKEAIEIFRSGFLMFLIQEGLIIILTGFLSIPEILHVLIGIDEPTIRTNFVPLAFFILGSTSVLFFGFVGLFGKLFEAVGKTHDLYKFNFFQQFIELLVFLLMITTGFSLLAVIIGVSIYKIIFVFLLAYRIKTLHPTYYPWWRGGSIGRALQDFRASIYLLVSNLIERFQNDGLTLLISALIGASILPVYQTIRTIGNSTVSGLTLLVHPTLPELQRGYATKNEQIILRLFLINFLTTGIIINSFLILIYPFIEYLYTVWTRGKLAFDSTFYLLIACHSVLFAFGYGWFAFLRSINVSKKVLTIIVIKVLIILLLVILMRKTITNAGFAIFIAEVVGTIVSLHYVYQELRSWMNEKALLRLSIFCSLPILYTLCSLYLMYLFQPSVLMSICCVAVLMLLFALNWFVNADVTLKAKAKSYFNLL